ncbi:protein ABHD18 [Glossina fuscipes]|uniref:Protein ABHD18 n=1 Tax=Glossina fuscipes TaxID=7396 RepID=A0A9C5ZHN7_9MUSC|nr:protein ABHD18 [Glossina fuscipes]
MAPSKLDSVYRRLLLTRFFDKGWGKPENLQRLFKFRKIISRRETCFPLIPNDYPVEIIKEEKHQDYTILEGQFLTPLELHLPGIVPKPVQDAHFQVVIPRKWKDQYKPICIHLAGTGDHFFWRRRTLIAKPLLKEGNIGAIILENPFYGARKPDNQVRSNLHNVSDIFVMGGCLIMECLVLLHWCERNGFGPLGVTGLSMGGHMASLAATNWPKPIVLVPCLSWSTAATVFTTGVMSQSINWDMLETQYYSDGKYRERLSKMVTIIDDAFTAGQKFMKDFNQSLIELKKDITYTKLLQGTSTLKTSENVIKSNKTIENCKMDKYFNGIGKNDCVTPEATKGKIESSSTLTKLMKYILPTTSRNASHRIDITKTNWWEREALQFMRGMMDECTHLKNFSVPYETSLIIAICAKDDAYVPREGCSSLEEIWPGVEVRYLDAGHVSAHVLHQKLFRSSIIEAFERAKKMHSTRKEDSSGDMNTSKLSYQQLLNKYVNAF